MNNPSSEIRNAVWCGSDLTGFDFSGFDLSCADLSDTYSDVVNFSKANLSGAIFKDSCLKNADFSGADLRKATFLETYLHNANFEGADLRYVDFYKSNLRHANLRNADLRKTSLTSVDLSACVLIGVRHSYDVPIIKNIHTAIRNAIRSNKLDMDDWHSCATTHCYAGWVIHLAGENGYALEEEIGTSAAAALIMQASDPQLERIPSWYQRGYEALATIVYLADQKSLANV